MISLPVIWLLWRDPYLTEEAVGHTLSLSHCLGSSTHVPQCHCWPGISFPSDMFSLVNLLGLLLIWALPDSSWLAELESKRTALLFRVLEQTLPPS